MEEDVHAADVGAAVCHQSHHGVYICIYYQHIVIAYENTATHAPIHATHYVLRQNTLFSNNTGNFVGGLSIVSCQKAEITNASFTFNTGEKSK